MGSREERLLLLREAVVRDAGGGSSPLARRGQRPAKVPPPWLLPARPGRHQGHQAGKRSHSGILAVPRCSVLVALDAPGGAGAGTGRRGAVFEVSGIRWPPQVRIMAGFRRRASSQMAQPEQVVVQKFGQVAEWSAVVAGCPSRVGLRDVRHGDHHPPAVTTAPGRAAPELLCGTALQSRRRIYKTSFEMPRVLVSRLDSSRSISGANISHGLYVAKRVSLRAGCAPRPIVN